MSSPRSASLFGTTTRTATLLVIAMLGETHAGEVAAILGRSRSRIKGAVDSLEEAGIVVGVDEGTAKRLRLNPRFFAAQELRALLVKLGEQDVDLQQRISAMRRRPRRAGKAI